MRVLYTSGVGETVDVALTLELERFVDERMRKGGHASRSEAVQEILQRVMEYEAARLEEIEELRAALQPAIEQALRGEGEPFDVEKIVTEGEKRLAERRAQSRAS